MLHYITDLETVFRECHRVLRGGSAAFVTAPERFIENHPMRGYFPSLPAVDLARFQPVDTVARAMRSAGFRQVTATIASDEPRRIDAEYVRKIEGRIISTYELLPAGEFEEGLRRLKADVARQGTLNTMVYREAATIQGNR